MVIKKRRNSIRYKCLDLALNNQESNHKTIDFSLRSNLFFWFCLEGDTSSAVNKHRLWWVGLRESFWLQVSTGPRGERPDAWPVLDQVQVSLIMLDWIQVLLQWALALGTGVDLSGLTKDCMGRHGHEHYFNEKTTCTFQLQLLFKCRWIILLAVAALWYIWIRSDSGQVPLRSHLFNMWTGKLDWKWWSDNKREI